MEGRQRMRPWTVFRPFWLGSDRRLRAKPTQNCYYSHKCAGLHLHPAMPNKPGHGTHPGRPCMNHCASIKADVPAQPTRIVGSRDAHLLVLPPSPGASGTVFICHVQKTPSHLGVNLIQGLEPNRFPSLFLVKVPEECVQLNASAPC